MRPRRKNDSATIKVLLIEDDEATRESAAFKLNKVGFEVVVASDGEEGLQKLRAGTPFSAVLLDLRMPRGDGFGFLEAKQKDSAIAQTTVIIFSNLSQPEYVKKALDLGAKGYLVKAHHSLQEIADEVRICALEGRCHVD